ncbi:uncharacterized protein LOC107640199 [Arachis ipaensis]|uniref:uncharacterized protein LOC107640199 n=1 Tax=Arachis ipaensis TaxID=130454 RepID=UPI0007AF113E|nr:uncharacterized protein LOC107640199 [Arachis ipaensis]
MTDNVDLMNKFKKTHPIQIVSTVISDVDYTGSLLPASKAFSIIKGEEVEGAKNTVKYDCFMITSDEDLQVMFHCRRQFSEVRTPELLAKLVDAVSSSGGSNRNTTTLATVAGSSSRPAVVSSSVPAYKPPVQPVASPSFAVDLIGSVGDEVGEGGYLPTSLQCAAPAGVGDGFLDDPEDDHVEPDMIADDNGDDVGEGVAGQTTEFGARDAEGSAGLTEFQVGQQFPDKEEALLSVKTYSIRRGVQYKVVESDYRRYVGKCSEFGNRCTWLIRLSLRQRKGIWEVKRYNGPHTCLATSISETTGVWITMSYRHSLCQW